MVAVQRGDSELSRSELLGRAEYLEAYAEKAPSDELREARLIAAAQIRKCVHTQTKN